MTRNVDDPDAVGGVIDSVGGAIGLLWNFLGKEPKKPDAPPPEPSTLAKIVGAASDVRAVVGFAREFSSPRKSGLGVPSPSEQSGASSAERTTRIPPIVVDTAGESIP